MANATTVVVATLANTANTAGCVDNGFVFLTYGSANGAIQNCNNFFILNTTDIVVAPIGAYNQYWFYAFPPQTKTAQPGLNKSTTFPQIP